MVIATRELHGVVMEHVALAWCVCVAGWIISSTVKGAGGFTALQRALQRTSHPRATPSEWRDQILFSEASKKKVRMTHIL